MRNLRIAHVADTHIGYRSGTISGRDEDFARSWTSACRAIVDSAPDLILHAGDVFHHPHPSWGAVSHFLDGASILREANVPIFMISGNHDSSRINMKHTIFSLLPGIVPHITISHDSEPVLHRIDDLQLEVILLSHRALINPLLQENLAAIMDRLNFTYRSVLVSHGSVGDLDKSRELGSIVIPQEVFEFPWSYVALGHLHLSQPHGANGWYSGSIERCGWSDYPASPAWTLTTLDPMGRLRHTQQPLPHLVMLQLPNLPCSGFTDHAIHEDIIRLIERSVIPEERMVVKILLTGISPTRQRGLSISTKRIVRERYPNIIFQLMVEGSAFMLDVPEQSTPIQRMMSIEDLFKEYVSQRTYPDPTFSERLLGKGLEVLEKTRTGEVDKDTGDERSEPRG